MILDIDDERSNTVVSVEYPYGTKASKILNDIKNYFEDGTEPYVSSLQEFRYSSRNIDQVDFYDYNGVRISKSVYNRLRSEAMRWNADKINRVLNTVLDEKSYYYIFSDTYELKVIAVEKAENIHERKRIYDSNKREREIPDKVINESPNRRRHSNNNRLSSKGGREYSEDDRYGDRQVRRQR